MKKVLAWILIAMLSLSLATAEAAGRTNEYGFKQISNSMSYSETYHRFVNNSSYFRPFQADRVIEMFNKAIDALSTPVPVYLYFVESSRSHPMGAHFEADSPFYLYLCEKLHLTASDNLKYTTFEEFCNYFYATDHHWNHRGAYQGYVDIIRMLLGEEEEVLVPAEEVTLPVVYNGYYARTRKQPVSTEQFSLYRYDNLKPYTSYVNGKRQKYDNIKAYLAGRCSDETYANHYQLCYGGNYAKIVFETGLTDKPNLLLFTNSMGAGVKFLLTNHFNRIVCIDLRKYQEEMKEALFLQNTVTEYEIDQILILGECQFFNDAKNLKP